jgi:hypothetical protein
VAHVTFFLSCGIYLHIHTYTYICIYKTYIKHQNYHFNNFKCIVQWH